MLGPLLWSAVGLGAAALAYRSKHSLPPRDAKAEEHFRELQDRLLEKRGIAARSRFVEVASPPLRMQVLDAGKGEPVILVHGGNSVALGWAPLIERLQSRFRLYAPDRPGCGLTTKFNYVGVDLRAHGVALLSAMMDGLGLERASIVGNSMGGYFGLVFALARPERVSKLVLIGEPAGSRTRASLTHRLIGTRVINSLLYGTVLKPSPQHLRKSLGLLMSDPRRVPDDLLECLVAGAQIPGAVESWITMVERAFPIAGAAAFHGMSQLTVALRPELHRLSTPTLFLWGNKDAFGSPTLGKEMAGLMPDARCDVVDDAGHLPWLDRPEFCAEAIAGFLA